VKKIYDGTDRALYEKKPRIALVLGVSLVFLAVGNHFLVGTVLPTVVLTLMGVIALLVGSSKEVLRLDFITRNLQYDSRLAGFVLRRIDDGFEHVSAVEVRDNSVDTSKPGEVTVQPAWDLILRYSGESPVGIVVQIFTTKTEAVVAARTLSDKMKVPLMLRIEANAPHS
jgi:hypothetical protein